jgi:two-component system OmpR family sensor kinase
MITTMALFIMATTLYYNYEKHRLLDIQRNVIKQNGESLLIEIRELHQNIPNKLTYPTYKNYKTAIFDIDKNYIFGDFKPQNIDFQTPYKIADNTLYHIKQVSPYYLGAAYIVVQKPINQIPIQNLLKMTLLFLVIAFFIFLVLGYFLGRLFTAPMRQSFERMNQFIQDTTHELNTPISTILTNIELLDELYNCEGEQERKRIEIASKTLSRLYDDLTYLKLNHEHHRDVVLCNISNLLDERILYFNSMIEAKKITLKTDITKNVAIMIDENDAIRLIDNLISNAIKYNKQKGSLEIILDKIHLSIKDRGIGMKKSELQMIFKRFERSNRSEGGFGIGMDIVSQIISFYDFKIDIQSKEKMGTKVNVRW